VVSIGLVDRSPAHPRQVFADALMDRASAVIIAYNHPTGSLEPSPADIEVAKQLKAAGTVMAISLLDHIIFNRSGYFSFLEAGKLGSVSHLRGMGAARNSLMKERELMSGGHFNSNQSIIRGPW